jgi:hypothetical protein
MRRVEWVLLALLMFLTAAPLHAQEVLSRPNTTPFQAPPTSPYLNMLRGGNPAVNYYGLVRPQVDSQRAIQQLHQQVAVPAPSTGLTMDAYPNSGHTVQFMNLSHYFSNNIGSGLTGGRMGGPANVRR